MNYVIRYHSKGDKDSYLTNTDLLSKKIGSKDILNFSRQYQLRITSIIL